MSNASWETNRIVGKAMSNLLDPSHEGQPESEHGTGHPCTISATHVFLCPGRTHPWTGRQAGHETEGGRKQRGFLDLLARAVKGLTCLQQGALHARQIGPVSKVNAQAVKQRPGEASPGLSIHPSKSTDTPCCRNRTSTTKRSLLRKITLPSIPAN